MNIFIIMPFEKEFDSVYQKLIKEPLEEKNHVVNRADDVSSHQSILKAIIQNISSADVIIADLTAQNPNVYYELGIGHTLNKPTIHIVQNFDDLGFDIKSYNAIKYSTQFDEAPELTERIFEIIEREPGNEYKFSNPVNDSLDGKKKAEITILAKDSPNKGEVTSSDSKEGVSDDIAPGILDSIVLAEESIEEIGGIIQELVGPMNVLSERTQHHTTKFIELNSNPNQKGLNSKRLQVARQFASDLNEFSDAVTERIPRLNESWNMLDQSIGYVFSFSSIQEESEIESVRETFINPTETLQRSIRDNLETLESFREAQRNLPKLSKATNRALSNSDRTLMKLCDEYRLGDSVLTRIINLATEMINRYYADNLNDGNTP